LVQDIDQFLEELRLKLASIDAAFVRLRAKMQIDAQRAEEGVRVRLARVRIGIERDRATRVAARAQMSQWNEGRTAMTSETIAARKGEEELASLRSRADQAERNAAAALQLALAALDEAEEAALEAWLARRAARSDAPRGGSFRS